MYFVCCADWHIAHVVCIGVRFSIMAAPDLSVSAALDGAGQSVI